MVNVLFLLNFLVTLSISIFLIYNFFKIGRQSIHKKMFFLFSLLGIMFFLFSILLFLWSFNIIEYLYADCILINAIMVSFESVLFFIAIYSTRKNKKLFYLLLMYVIIFLSIFIGGFANLILFSSLLLIMILFLLIINSEYFHLSSRLGIFYASLSLFLQFSSLFYEGSYLTILLICNISFSILIFFFIHEFKKTPPLLLTKKDIKLTGENYFLDFLRYFVFIIILTNFIFIGTLAIHEGGHFVSSKFVSGCRFEKIVYEGGFPRTEILCGDSSTSINIILLGGILFPILVALLLFFGGGAFIRKLAFMIIGFNILISYQDFIDLGLSQNISLFFSIIGAVTIILTIAFLAKSRTNEEEFINLGEIY